MTPLAFTPPGPGTWEQDSTHCPRPLTEHFLEVFSDGFTKGFKEGSARYGLLFNYLEPALVNGYLYYRDNVVNPEDAEEVGRRFAAAERALEGRIWREDLDRWDREYMPDSIQRNRALERVDLAALTDEDLAEHLRAVRENAREMLHRHHIFSIPSLIPMGLYLANAMAWTGLDAGEVLAALKGSSPVSLGARNELRELALALASTGLGPSDFSGDSAQETLDQLRERDDAVGARTREYLSAIGLRLAGGYDVADPCAIELPEMLLGTIWAAVGAHGEPTGEEWKGAAERVRNAVPEEHRDRFDELLADARLVNRLRDERGIYNDNWGTGIARAAILEAGRRLKESGKILDAMNAVDASIDELAALLRGEGGPSGDDLAERTRRRERAALEEAPPFLGAPPEPPPPLDGLPPHVAQVMGAVGAVMTEVFGHGPKKSEGAISGRAVSPGTYSGTARIVDHPSESNRLEKGDVLVTESTSSAFNVVLPLLGAIVTDRGGQLSHAAIVAREYGIPAVVGTTNATRDIPDGATIRVDGTAGTVEIV